MLAMAKNKKNDVRVFLAPRSNETSYKNFLSTIENGVDYAIVEPHLADDGKKLLSKEDKLFVWGNKETKKASWDKMEEDDVVLFYKKGAFVYAGQLLFKQHSKSLGLSLWPPKKGEKPWTCIFFLKNLQPIHFPIQDLNEISGGEYSMGMVQGFMPLKDSVTEKILHKFGSTEDFLKFYAVTSEQVERGELEEASNISEDNAHREAQMLLLKIGMMLGYETYSPDRKQEAYGESLGSYSSLRELPQRYIGKEILTFVRKIDVLWFKDEIPRFAFEVENTTGLRSGFQRLVQLQPLQTRLFIVAKDSDKELYYSILETDPYYKNRPSFRFKSYKDLEKFFTEIDRSEKIKKVFLE